MSAMNPTPKGPLIVMNSRKFNHKVEFVDQILMLNSMAFSPRFLPEICVCCSTL